MTREGAIQVACLYGPLVSAALMAWWLRPGPRLLIGVLFSLAWNVSLLPWLDGLAQAAGLWTYHSETVALAGMPLALFFGWVIAWGVCAPLLAELLGGRIWMAAALLVAIDLRAMPEMTPVLELGPNWWWGEFGVAAVLLIPSMWLARWTDSRKRTGLRCAMLVPGFGGIFLGIPMLVLCGDVAGAMRCWQSFADVTRIGILLGAVIFAIPGLTAVRDLARSGDGTPVPFDPPRRLVTHGIYAYVRNPMQISMTLMLMLESVVLWSFWPAVLALLGVVYSEGLARWSENEDMRLRFGGDWESYRKSVRSWCPRWHPRMGDDCELWLDAACGSCSQVARWFQSMNPHKLKLRDANTWPGKALERVTWHHPPSGRRESGVAAIAIALQHLSLPWAAVGWIAGLPGVSQMLQICFDAAGTGKRKEEATVR